MFVYRLSCEEETILICGDKPLDVHKAVQEALSKMSNEEILSPQEDWFWLILSNVCNANGFKLFEADGIFNVEEMYWQEHRNREQVSLQ